MNLLTSRAGASLLPFAPQGEHMRWERGIFTSSVIGANSPLL